MCAEGMHEQLQHTCQGIAVFIFVPELLEPTTDIPSQGEYHNMNQDDKQMKNMPSFRKSST
jgi:hypothetical protein